MAASWKGTIGITVGPMTFPVPVSLHPACKSRSSDSFKTLAPNGQPIKQVYIDSDGQPVSRDATGKGIELSKGEYRALSEAQVEAIESGQRSKTVEPMGYADRSTVPLDLAMSTYTVEPGEGAEASLNQLWNGLREAGAVYTSTITLRQRDAVLVIYADESGLKAATLPFASEINPSKFEPTVSEAEAQAVAAALSVTSFDHGAFASEYTAKRAQVIDEVLTGAPAPEATPTADTTATVDLMAALIAAQAELTDKVTAKAVTA